MAEKQDVQVWLSSFALPRVVTHFPPPNKGSQRLAFGDQFSQLRRRHADDRERIAVHHNAFADDARIARKATLPQCISNHHHGGALAIILCREESTTLRPELAKQRPCVSAIINRALEKDPNKRYQTGAEMARDIQRCAKQTQTPGQ